MVVKSLLSLFLYGFESIQGYRFPARSIYKSPIRPPVCGNVKKKSTKYPECLQLNFWNFEDWPSPTRSGHLPRATCDPFWVFVKVAP